MVRPGLATAFLLVFSTFVNAPLLELANAREMLEAQSAEAESLRRQLQSLQQERSEVRLRVEKLLGDVDSILEE